VTGREAGRASVTEAARVCERTRAARAVAHCLPFAASREEAQATRDRAPFWFHTFALNRQANIYTPGVAHDARHRLRAMPASLAAQRVLDIGTFDGFFAFLAEHRGAARVVAIDNEQYREWVRARWGFRLLGAEGFRAIAQLRNSAVAYVRLDATHVRALDEEFDLILCLGVLHRVSDPARVARALASVLAPSGHALIETYGHMPTGSPSRADSGVKRTFTAGQLAELLARAGLTAETLDLREIHGHPRLLVRASKSP
jgi:tRNA (mo5U34)-methyltransferase